MRIVVDGQPIPAEAGDSLAVAMLRSGIHPGRGGTLCLAGDCPHCTCAVDGVPYTRTCQRPARAGTVVERHPLGRTPAAPPPGGGPRIEARNVHVGACVIGGGPAGTAEADALRAAGRDVLVLDAGRGEEVVGVYAGPVVVARVPDGLLHVHCDEVVVATGAAEEQPACPGNDLDGLLTARAADALAAAGVALGTVARVELPERPLRFEGAGRVEAVVVRRADGGEERRACTTAVLGLGLHPRDGLARMGSGLPVRVVGEAALPAALPPEPVDGVFCPCTGATADDLRSVWERGFREVELVKRATLACTGTCQGSACLPHLRGFLAARGVAPPPPITARPLARQVTVEEAAAGFHFAPVRRTALHGEHVRLGAQLERFGGWWRPWTYGDTTARSTGRCARASRSATSAPSARWSSRARTPSRCSSASTRATSRTSRPGACATRSCSTSAATASTTGSSRARTSAASRSPSRRAGRRSRSSGCGTGRRASASTSASSTARRRSARST